MESLICCEKCLAWKKGGCTLGFEVEPLYFRYCFVTEGQGPTKKCTGPHREKLPDEPSSENRK